MASAPLTFTYRSIAGVDLTLDLFLPAAAPLSDRGHPVLIWFHGGGLLQGSKSNLPAHFKQLATPPSGEAIAVITPDYRLAPQTPLPEILTDIDALFTYIKSDALASSAHIDVERIAVSGGSAGGYLALIAGLASSSPDGVYGGNGGPGSGIKCLTPYYPITDLTDPFWTTKQAMPSWLSSPVTDEQALPHLNPNDPACTSSAPGSARSCLYGYMLQHGLLASLLFPPSNPRPREDRYGFDSTIPSEAELYSIPQRLKALPAGTKLPPVYITYGTVDDAVNPFDSTVAALRAAAGPDGVIAVHEEQGLGHAYDEDEKWWDRAQALRSFLAQHL